MHPLQSGWICAVSLCADLKGNQSQLTCQPKICNVFKASLKEWVDNVFQICTFLPWSNSTHQISAFKETTVVWEKLVLNSESPCHKKNVSQIEKGDHVNGVVQNTNVALQMWQKHKCKSSKSTKADFRTVAGVAAGAVLHKAWLMSVAADALLSPIRLSLATPTPF